MNKTYRIRIIFVAIIFCILYLIAILNLFFIQINNHSFFTLLGEKQYSIEIKQIPARASIFDRTGIALARNKEGFAAFIVPRMITDQKKVHQFLKKYFPEALSRLEHRTEKQFLYIKRRLTPHELELIAKHAPEDIKILKEPRRYYPVDCVAPLVGITDIDNTGLLGIELSCNKQLAGTPATLSLKKDARSGFFYMQQTTKQPGHEGTPVILTIDSTLQFLAWEELTEAIERFHADEGAVLIMDPNTGEILTMVSYPTFDPNTLDVLDVAKTKNICITDAYELGSVIKACAATAAIEERVVTSDELIDCENVKETMLNGIHITTTHANGIIPFSKVIQQSNNIGIAKVTQRLGAALYDHYLRMGFGKKTGILLPGEHQGFVNPPHKWTKQSIYSLSYGYEITATLLQLARTFSLFVNGGKLVQPTIIVDAARGQTPLSTHQPLYSHETLDVIKHILAQTVEEGSGHEGRIAGFVVRGKTGTANLLINKSYNKEHNIYTFAGIVEKGSYQRVIITFIKNVRIQAPAGRQILAAQVAVPLFKNIAQKMILHDNMI